MYTPYLYAGMLAGRQAGMCLVYPPAKDLFVPISVFAALVLVGRLEVFFFCRCVGG